MELVSNLNVETLVNTARCPTRYLLQIVVII
jgi:hypothetical protein